MNIFENNIINIYGKFGKLWLNNLPKLIDDIALKFNVTEIRNCDNLSYNYVAFGVKENTPIILKVGPDIDNLAKESFALQHFTNSNAVKIIDQGKGFLILERMIPGICLKNHFFAKETESIKIVCNMVKQISQTTRIFSYNFPHIREWFTILDKEMNIPDFYLTKARYLCNKLLSTSKAEILLHGDLHHDNILKNQNSWIMIDPKGVIGEIDYELTAFICNPLLELLDSVDSKNIISNRIVNFAEILKLSPKRILDWCFVKSVLSWAWALEDNCEIKYWMQLTKILNIL